MTIMAFITQAHSLSLSPALHFTLAGLSSDCDQLLRGRAAPAREDCSPGVNPQLSLPLPSFASSSATDVWFCFRGIPGERLEKEEVSGVKREDGWASGEKLSDEAKVWSNTKEGEAWGHSLK